MKTLLIAALLGFALVCTVLAQDKGQPKSDAVADYPGCVRIFNGQNFDGWEADPSTWSIVDGAMRGVAGTSRLAYTKADYGSFRLIFTARMNPANGDHLGVLFWGDRPKDPAKPKIDNAGWIQFMPPHGAMWDYHPPKHHNLLHETLAAGSRDFTKWSTTELLCNLEKGTIRAAVNGVEIARYNHPYASERKDPEKRVVAGPIGMFRHGGGASEYKAIYVETNPKGDKLLTEVREPAEEGPEPDLKPLFAQVRTLVEKHYPKATCSLKDQTIHFEFNTRKFMIHSWYKTGEWQDAHEEPGPQLGGIYGDIELHAGKWGGQAATPQSFDKRYFTLLLATPYSGKLNHHLYVYLKYPRDVPKDFLQDFERLTNEFDKHVSPPGK